MKKLLLLAGLIAASLGSYAEKTFKVRHFTKIIASPHVNVVLKKGTEESVTIVSDGVPEEKINVVVHGHLLRIYLDDAKVLERQVFDGRGGWRHKRGLYQNQTITAYITYVELNKLDVRGEQSVACESPLESKRFKLKAYGECNISLSSVRSDYFKVVLLGENKLRIQSGRVPEAFYKLYGANHVDATQVDAGFIASKIYGEGRLAVRATNTFFISSIGEPDVRLVGGARLAKGLVIGEGHFY